MEKLEELNYHVACFNTALRELDSLKQCPHKYHNPKRSISKNLRRLHVADANLKQLASELGRKNKRIKHLKKTTKIVTLTEVNGEPWRIRVKK